MNLRTLSCPNKKPHTPWLSVPDLLTILLTKSQAAIHLLSISTDLPILEILYKWSHTLGSPLWPAYFFQHHYQSTFMAASINTSFYSQITFHCTDRALFSYLLISWQTFGLFSLPSYYEHWYRSLYGLVFISPGYTLRSGITRLYRNCMFNNLRNYRQLSKAAELHTSVAALVIICLFYSNHPSRCKVVSHCGLTCKSLITNDAEHLFYVYWPFVYLPWRNIYSHPLTILNRIICLL